MICFAVCVGGDGSKYAEVAEPYLRGTAGPDDQIWTTQGAPGICVAYNDFIDRARMLPECEALVLLHDDVEIHDPQFRAKVLSAVAEPDVAVVGVIGGSGLYNGAWWESRAWGGEAMYTPEVVGNFATRYAEVDTVDGFLMVLSRRALAALRFDEQTFPAWHGYDTDFCLSARRQGLKVLVRPLEVFHRTKATLGDSEAFYAAKKQLVAKYPDLIRRRAAWEWTADTAERAARVVRRKQRARQWRQMVGDGVPQPEGQQVSRRAGEAAPAIDPSRVRALWLHEAAVDGVVVDVGDNPDFLEAGLAEGLDVHAAPDGLASWRSATPGARPRAITMFDSFARTPDLRDPLRAAFDALGDWGALLIETSICETEPFSEPDSRGRRCPGVGVAELQQALHDTGFEIERFVVMSDAPYRSRESMRERRRQRLLAGEPWPPRDLVRVIARKPVIAREPDQ